MNEPMLAAKRLSPRWPPLSIRPQEDGAFEYRFVLFGHRWGLPALATAIALSIAIVALLSLNQSYLSSPWTLPLALVATASVAWIACIGFLRMKTTLIYNSRQQIAIVLKQLFGLHWVARTSSSELDVSIIRVKLIRAGQLFGPWCGFAVAFSAEHRFIFSPAIVKTFQEAHDYVISLPECLRSRYQSGDAFLVADY